MHVKYADNFNDYPAYFPKVRTRFQGFSTTPAILTFFRLST